MLISPLKCVFVGGLPRYVRVNTLKASVEAVQSQLSKEGWWPTDYDRDHITYDDFLHLLEVSFNAIFFVLKPQRVRWHYYFIFNDRSFLIAKRLLLHLSSTSLRHMILSHISTFQLLSHLYPMLFHAWGFQLPFNFLPFDIILSIYSTSIHFHFHACYFCLSLVVLINLFLKVFWPSSFDILIFCQYPFIIILHFFHSIVIFFLCLSVLLSSVIFFISLYSSLTS